MALNDINFIRGQGIGGVDPINSHISALLFYSDTLPSGFAADDRVKPIFGVAQAEALGIVNDFADETAAVDGTVQVTVKGATDDIETVSIGGVAMWAYTILSTDSDVDAVATGIAALINSGTGDHGFTAAAATDTVTVTPPVGMGVVLGSNAMTYASSGTGTATVVDFDSAAAVGSFFSVMHYHISEFFRMKPNGKLYVGIYAEASFDGTGVAEIIDFAGGEVRRIGILETVEPFATSMLSAVQAILVTKRDEHKPADAILHADMSGLTSSTLSDLTNATSSKVNVNAGEDGNYLQAAYTDAKAYIVGDKVTFLDKVYINIQDSTAVNPTVTTSWAEINVNLRTVTGYSISTLGNEVGVKASGALSQSIAEVQAFNLTSGNTLSEAGLATGELFRDAAIALLDSIADKNYTFLRNFEGREGVYYTDSYTAISRSDDYNSLERNEVMDEAERLVYSALLPRLSSRVYLAEDGTLSQDVIDDYTELCVTALTALETSGDISGAPTVTIDPNQNIAQTSKLVISFTIQPVGIARNIEVNNSYKVNIGG